jgi:formate-dependent nitrite reductase membrane component NrfD
VWAAGTGAIADLLLDMVWGVVCVKMLMFCARLWMLPIEKALMNRLGLFTACLETFKKKAALLGGFESNFGVSVFSHSPNR